MLCAATYTGAVYKTATYFNIVVMSDNNSRCLLSMSTKQKGAQSKQSDIGAEMVIPTKQEKKAQYKAYYNANRGAISSHKKAHNNANKDMLEVPAIKPTIMLIGML